MSINNSSENQRRSYLLVDFNETLKENGLFLGGDDINGSFVFYECLVTEYDSDYAAQSLLPFLIFFESSEQNYQTSHLQ